MVNLGLNKEWLLKRICMGVAICLGGGVLAATFTKKPAVHRTAPFESYYRSQTFGEGVRSVDAAMLEACDAVDGQIAPRADNLTIARRISLALVGSGMSLEEIRAFEAISTDNQIRWWTNYLLSDKRWADYFAERFSRAFLGTNNGQFIVFRRRKFQLWLSDQFEKGTGYDQIVREIIRSEGLWTDTPQVNFITATVHDDSQGRSDPVQLAGRTSRAFLAQRIDCVECHNDFLGSLNFGTDANPVPGTQQHFHGLAAFYSGATIADPAFSGIIEDGRPYLYKYLGDEAEIQVVPNVPFQPELLSDTGKPRERLADWVTHPDNRAFANATVNRVWALMFSRPLVAPVDSIPLSEQIPTALKSLSLEFSRNGFDMKRLIRQIVETEVFQRESRAPFEVKKAHEDSWAVFPLTQLRPEQVSNCLMQSSKLAAIDLSSSILTRLQSFGDGANFLKQFGDRGEDEFDSEAVTIAQRLVLMNGPEVVDRAAPNLISNASSRVAFLVSDDTQAINMMFLSVLNRYPSPAEIHSFAPLLQGKKGEARSIAMGDMYWAMVNLTEFSWNH